MAPYRRGAHPCLARAPGGSGPRRRRTRDGGAGPQTDPAAVAIRPSGAGALVVVVVREATAASGEGALRTGRRRQRCPGTFLPGTPFTDSVECAKCSIA